MTQIGRMTAEFYLTLRMTNGRKQKKVRPYRVTPSIIFSKAPALSFT